MRNLKLLIRILPKIYLRQSDGVLFVFDLSNKESFDKLELWYDLYKKEKKNCCSYTW